MERKAQCWRPPQTSLHQQKLHCILGPSGGAARASPACGAGDGEPGVWGRTGHPCRGNVMVSRTSRDRGDFPLARPEAQSAFPSPDTSVAWSQPGDREPLVSQPLPGVCRATAGDNSALISSSHSAPLQSWESR
uniref:Uncharacterized protein n=1 Tax=Molossus molossus TaxID=27622 RepID=A0A7J8F9I1_MOLMO|nr:hypothetical protein HJG59_008611 [Molossus molossus]